MAERYVRLPEVRARLGGVSRTTIWRWQRTGAFPKPIALGPNTVAWLESEVDAWMAERRAAASNEP
jgi:prophage regulatory protein